MTPNELKEGMRKAADVFDSEWEVSENGVIRMFNVDGDVMCPITAVLAAETGIVCTPGRVRFAGYSLGMPDDEVTSISNAADAEVCREDIQSDYRIAMLEVASHSQKREESAVFSQEGVDKHGPDVQR